MTLGQFAYKKYTEIFPLYMSNWEDLPSVTKERWESFANEIGLEYLVQNDCHC